MIGALAISAAAAQAALMGVDEGYFHRARGLPRWERVGHPLDTLTVAACYAWLALAPTSSFAIWFYAGLAAFSCLFVTKDEVVHPRLCTRAECWLHAVLFVVHPIVLALFGFAWLRGERTLVFVQLALTLAFGAYQTVYWNVLRRARA
jgi:hypothetical protein